MKQGRLEHPTDRDRKTKRFPHHPALVQKQNKCCSPFTSAHKLTITSYEHLAARTPSDNYRQLQTVADSYSYTIFIGGHHLLLCEAMILYLYLPPQRAFFSEKHTYTMVDIVKLNGTMVDIRRRND